MNECPWRLSDRCRLAEHVAGAGLPIVTTDGACKVCRERHTSTSPDEPGTVVASLVAAQCPAALERMRPHLLRERPANPQVSRGPGTDLKAALARDGYPTCGECAVLASEMDRWGYAECWRRREEILDRMVSNSGKALGSSAKLSHKLKSVAPRFLKRSALAGYLDNALRLSGDVGSPEAVAVVIPCHNYGAFLPEALDSVLAQSHRPAEVIVVDDSSTDDTAAGAGRYAALGVQYIRIEARDVHKARKAGYERTKAPLLCFLDADDKLPADYLSRAVDVLRSDWRVAIAHSNWERFGAETGPRTFPEEVRAADLQRDNQIHAGAVVRRSALRISRAFDVVPDLQSHADWSLWRAVLSHGWTARNSGAVYQYRRHAAGSLLTTTLSRSWPERYGLGSTRVSLLIPLAGRREAWRRLRAFLDRQTWPRDQLQVVLADTSQDPSFGQTVRLWAVDSGYPDLRVVSWPVGMPGLADLPRKGAPVVQEAVNDVMCRIWGRLARCVESDWVWTLEDDVVPPEDVLRRLLSHFRPEVDTVCAPYRSRLADYWVVMRGRQTVLTKGHGVERVTSCGFGCMVTRADLFRSHVFAEPPHGRWYDPWYAESRGLHVLCDWECVARHG